MTAVELKTSIMADLDQMSVEMLEDVSHYVKRLRRVSRPAHRKTATQSKRDAAMLFVKGLSVRGGQPVPADESGVAAIIDEKYDK